MGNWAIRESTAIKNSDREFESEKQSIIKEVTERGNGRHAVPSFLLTITKMQNAVPRNLDQISHESLGGNSK